MRATAGGLGLALAAAVLAACGGADQVTTLVSAPEVTRAMAASDPAPWSDPPIAAGRARDVAVAIWGEAANREQARLVIPADTLLPEGGQPRPANFGEGGWAVAWDSPGLPGVATDGTPCDDCGRGVMGIAAVDLIPNPSFIRSSPVVLEWSDGGLMGYGGPPSGSQWIANFIVPGQRSTYQLWSYIGDDHLDYLITQLRFVAGAP